MASVFTVQDNKVKWSNSYGQLIEVKGQDSVPFEMQSKSSTEEEEIETFIDVTDLAEAKQVLETVYRDYNDTPLFTTIEPPFTSDNHLLFRLSTKLPFSQGDKPECKICKLNVDISLMRLHVAWHFFNGDISGDFCGYCGIICSSSLSLRLTSGSKVNGTYKTASNCKYFYSFSMKCATKQSTNNPCSNRAYICTLCTGTVVWTYNLKSHYDKKHESIECPIR